MKSKKILALALAATLLSGVCAVTACGDGGDTEQGGTSSGYSMDITKQVTEWKKVTKNDTTYYQAEGVVYCANPTAKAKQCLNIYIPAEYMNEDGSINTSGTCNGYTSATAPILYINSVGAYQGKVPYKITDPTETLAMKEGWYFNYIKQGFVLAFSGARGRSDYDNSTKVATGKAPVALADLKAGIRFLKHNDDVMPGDANKIISNGMSAGGAMSILIGVSGNSSEFDSYLQEMGAVMDETDDVYAAQVYCPITDLEHADFAYEWYFQNDTSATANGLSTFQKALSSQFYQEYITYFNAQNITVNGTTYSINADGRSGNFVDWMLSNYEKSYKAANGQTATLPSYLSAIDTIVTNHNSRSKVCPTFDSLDLSSSENGVFGSRTGIFGADSVNWARHFSVPVTEVIKSMQSQFATEYAQYYASYNADSSLADVQEQVKLYNPYTYLNAQGTSNATTVASKIRICVGTTDSDTSPAVSGQLALKLMSLGVDTEYNLIWNLGHTDADTAGAYEAWVNSICK